MVHVQPSKKQTPSLSKQKRPDPTSHPPSSPADEKVGSHLSIGATRKTPNKPTHPPLFLDPSEEQVRGRTAAPKPAAAPPLLPHLQLDLHCSHLCSCISAAPAPPRAPGPSRPSVTTAIFPRPRSDHSTLCLKVLDLCLPPSASGIHLVES